MPQILKTFRKAAPAVKLSLQTPNCYEIREKILNGTIDLGIHYDINGYGSSLVTEQLEGYDLVLVGSTELTSLEQDFTSKGQKKDICLLTTDKNSLYHKIFDEYLRMSDITLNGEMELVSTEAIKRSVIGNVGVSYLPRFTVDCELEQGILQELPTSISNKKIGSVCTYHKNKWVTPAMDLFMDLLRESAGKRGSV